MSWLAHGVWWLLGAAGGFALLRSHSSALGSPVEAAIPNVTPHGGYGASRKGPPAHDHQGVDLLAPAGSHVLAVGVGRIVSTQPGLGKVVLKLQLDEPAAWSAGGVPIAAIVYADLGTPLVEPGDRVLPGDPIATVAQRGFVHFAVKTPGGRFIDPRLAGFVYRAARVG